MEPDIKANAIKALEKFMPSVSAAQLEKIIEFCESAMNSDLAEMERLIAEGVDVNMKINDATFLMLAVKFVKPSAVKVLLEVGVDVNVKNNRGKTALMLAWEKRLENCNTHINPISSSALEEWYQSPTDIVKMLLEAGASIDVTSIEYLDALLWAASSGESEEMLLLLGAGGNVNTRDNEGWTPLIRAVNAGHVEMVKILLDADADINVTNNNNETALTWATYKRHDEIVMLLLDAGADINIKNNNGDTAMDLATPEVARLIKAYQQK